MKNITIILFVLFILIGCSNSKKCNHCQEFFLTNKPFKYKYQVYDPSWHEGVFDLKTGQPIRYGHGRIMEKYYFDSLNRNLFCFYGMSYPELLNYIPDAISTREWDTTDYNYILSLQVRLGDWTRDVYSYEKHKRIPWDTITSLGFLGSIDLNFKLIDGKLIFVGDENDARKYKDCKD